MYGMSLFHTTDEKPQNTPLEGAKQDLTRQAVILNPNKIYSIRNEEDIHLKRQMKYTYSIHI
jgi:hypothetical protein